MDAKQLILLGPPGAGTEKYAISLTEKWQVPVISMQGVIRDAVVQGTDMGETIRASREKSEPISDELLLKLLKKRFEQPDVMLNGWILEGFPTSLVQAEALDALLLSFGLPTAQAAYIRASTGILINRLAQEAGAGKSVSALRDRITAYKEQILPVMEYYQQKETMGESAPSRLTVINGSQSAAEIENALAQLEHEETGAARFINEEELNVLIEKEALLIVDCVASWCGPCKQVSPLIDRLAEGYGDRATVVKLDFDNNRQVSKRFKLKGMPSVMFFQQGELKETLTGMKPYSIYDKTLLQFL
ncbi:MAG: nucleoside monophosphate kinase [Cyanobacteria bacterium J06631_12]